MLYNSKCKTRPGADPLNHYHTHASPWFGTRHLRQALSIGCLSAGNVASPVEHRAHEAVQQRRKRLPPSNSEVSRRKERPTEAQKYADGRPMPLSDPTA